MTSPSDLTLDDCGWCSWTLFAGLLPLVVLFVWYTGPSTKFDPKSMVRLEHLQGAVTSLDDLPYFGNLFYLVRHWQSVAVKLLAVARARDWKTSVFSAPNFGGLGGGLVLLTTEESIKHVLKDNFDNYEKGSRFRSWFSDFLGNGIFATDGKIWKHHRKVASHMFSQRLLKHTLAVGYDVSRQMMTRLRKQAHQGAVVDMQDIFFRFTIDIFTLVAFGTELGSFVRTQQHPFAQAFDRVQQSSQNRIPTAGLWKLSKMLQLTEDERAIKQGVRVIDDFASQVIKQKRRTMPASSKEMGPDLISRFLDSARKTGDPITDREIRDIVLNFMIAGRDTTACALTWCIYELIRNPDCADKIRKEAHSLGITGIEASQPLSTGKTCNEETVKMNAERYAALRAMKYTEAFIYEALRLHPSVPIDIKYAKSDDMLPDGTKIPKGCITCYSPYVLGRSPKVWPTYDPDEFKPQRWLDRSAEKRPSNFAYPQFNAGPRLCLGKGLALLEIKLGLAQLLHGFKVPKGKWGDNKDGKEDVEYQMTLTHPVKGGLPVELEERTEEEQSSDAERWKREENADLKATSNSSDEDSFVMVPPAGPPPPSGSAALKGIYEK